MRTDRQEDFAIPKVGFVEYPSSAPLPTCHYKSKIRKPERQADNGPCATLRGALQSAVARSAVAGACARP